MLLSNGTILLSGSTLDASLSLNGTTSTSLNGRRAASGEQVLAALQQDWLLDLERRPLATSSQNGDGHGNGTGLSLSTGNGTAEPAGKVAVSPSTPGESLLQPADDDWLILNRN
jgi:hypothetical protein